MNFAIEFLGDGRMLNGYKRTIIYRRRKKYDRISLLQFRIIEFYFEKSFPPSDKYPEINDSMEISWICRYYDAEFKRAYENASDLFRSKISSERLMGYVKLFTDEFFNENHADFRYYVTCFRIRMICLVSGGDMRMTGAELPSDLTWMY